MVMNTQLLFIKSHQYILLHNSWLAIFKSSQRGPHGILQFTHGNVDKSNKTFISRWFRGKALVQIATTCANDSKVLMYLHGYIGTLSISSHHLPSKNVACCCTLVESSRRLPVQSSNLFWYACVKPDMNKECQTTQTVKPAYKCNSFNIMDWLW